MRARRHPGSRKLTIQAHGAYSPGKRRNKSRDRLFEEIRERKKHPRHPGSRKVTIQAHGAYSPGKLKNSIVRKRGDMSRDQLLAESQGRLHRYPGSDIVGIPGEGLKGPSGARGGGGIVRGPYIPPEPTITGPTGVPEPDLGGLSDVESPYPPPEPTLTGLPQPKQRQVEADYAPQPGGYQPPGEVAADYDRYQPYMEAMEETQRRAAQDRATALEGITQAMTGGGAAYGAAQEAIQGAGAGNYGAVREAIQGAGAEDYGAAQEAIQGAMAQAKEAYAPAQALLKNLQNAPESINFERAYGQVKAPILAMAQDRARRVQESYGGIPSGASLSAIGREKRAGLGRLARAATDIELERQRTRRSDLLNAIKAAQGLGTARAGIGMQGAGMLANIYGQQAQYGLQRAGMLGDIASQQAQYGLQRAGMLGDVASQRAQYGLQGAGMAADVLGQTVAAVPQLPGQGEQVQPVKQKQALHPSLGDRLRNAPSDIIGPGGRRGMPKKEKKYRWDPGLGWIGPGTF